MDRIKSFLKRILSYITPGYVVMVVAAFVLWYITKLGEEYTTEHEVMVIIDGEEYKVKCTVQGKGTDLITYTMIDDNSCFVVPSSELSFDIEEMGDDGVKYRHVTNVSLQQVLSARMKDVKVVAVTGDPIKIKSE